MGSFFIGTTEVDASSLLEVEGVPVLEKYGSLDRFIRSRLHPGIAAVLAEPVIGRDPDGAMLKISWYGEKSGTARPLEQLDEEAQRGIRKSLQSKLEALQTLTRDPEFGSLLSAALNVERIGAVWVVDGDPVLLNWGMLPAGIQEDSSARARHFARTFGLANPAAENPRTPENTGSPSLEETPSPRVGGAQEFPSSTSDDQSRHASGPVARPSLGFWGFAPLLAMLTLAAGAMVWLLLPGTRIMPAAGDGGGLLLEKGAADVVRASNDALRERTLALRQAIDGSVCIDGGLFLPDGSAAASLLPTADPAKVAVSQSMTGGETASLLQLMEENTVLIVSEGDNGVSIGSGFFIGPELIVTNDHVIEGNIDGDGIYITNTKLRSMHSAELVAQLGPLEETGGDFALLKVEGLNMSAYNMFVSDASLKLESVIAAGYPSALLDTDANFIALIEGDPTAVPELVFTNGIVSTEQEFGPETQAIVHTAQISRGHSGGPLVDACGRVVGVNTFGRSTDNVNINFALAASDLVRFLESAGVTVPTESEVCVPQLRATTDGVGVQEPQDK